MLTSEIVTYLSGKVGSYTLNRGVMTDDVDTVVCVYEYAVTAPDFKLGAQGLKFEHPSFQVVVRGAATDYDGPRAIAETVVTELSKVWTTTLSGVTYNWVQPIQAVFWLRTDEKNRHYFAVNFRTEKVPS